MKYTAILKNKEVDIDVIPCDSHHYRVVIDGEIHDVDVRHCRFDLLSVLVANRSYDISFSTDDTRVRLNFSNRYFDIEVLDERRMRMRHVGSHLKLQGPEIIKTSMPGKIVEVLVEEGQEVQAGKGIVIIEAMKMENELVCINAGIVKKVFVKPGDAVVSNAALVEIVPPENAAETPQG
ncbi:MAG: biotin/lipoyl-binding protein [bacterium]|nr:biotin/lipoyl-binding protein [bacterium]